MRGGLNKTLLNGAVRAFACKHFPALAAHIDEAIERERREAEHEAKARALGISVSELDERLLKQMIEDLLR